MTRQPSKWTPPKLETSDGKPLSIGQEVYVEGIICNIHEAPEFVQVEIQLDGHTFWCKASHVRSVPKVEDLQKEVSSGEPNS